MSPFPAVNPQVFLSFEHKLFRLYFALCVPRSPPMHYPPFGDNNEIFAYSAWWIHSTPPVRDPPPPLSKWCVLFLRATLFACIFRRGFNQHATYMANALPKRCFARTSICIIQKCRTRCKACSTTSRRKPWSTTSPVPWRRRPAASREPSSGLLPLKAWQLRCRTWFRPSRLSLRLVQPASSMLFLPFRLYPNLEGHGSLLIYYLDGGWTYKHAWPKYLAAGKADNRPHNWSNSQLTYFELFFCKNGTLAVFRVPRSWVNLPCA